MEQKSSRNSFNIILAAGGTGGHLFPAIAIADAIREISPESRCLFITSGKQLEKNILDAAGYNMETITVSGIAGLGIFTKIRAALKIPGAVSRSAGIIKNFNADAVIGMGSYTAGPVLMASKMMGIKTGIHEQNRRPGITNRIMSKYSGRVYSSFEDTFPDVSDERLRFLGNPVRSNIVSNSGINHQRTSGIFRVLVIGGSQGSRNVNSAVMNALPLLEEKNTAYSDFEFIHQTGTSDYEAVKAAYGKTGIKAEVSPFFTDMERLYSEADLLVCRAGASTVAEISVMGKPAIFIPFPAAAGGHQSENAEALEKAGAASVIEEKDLSPEILAEKIISLKNSPEKMKLMAETSKKMGKPEAALNIADDILSWIESRV